MNIAVTGGLGTGKSTTSRLLATALKAELVDIDYLCRQQMQPGKEGFTAFKDIFSNRFLQDNGSIDRSLLRQAIFSDIEVKEKLEDILHPIVWRQIVARYAACSTEKKDLVVEVPLLFEVGWQDAFDANIVVYVPEDLCIQRVINRGGISRVEATKILNSQMPIAEKLVYGHFIINNAGTFVSTVRQVSWLARSFLKKERFS